MNPALRASAAHVFVESVESPRLSDDDAHHLLRVLRLRDGEAVTVSDGAGLWRTTTLAAGGLVADGDVVSAAPPPRVTIGAAIPKGDRLEWMVQKLTELGVTTVVLVECARSSVRWDAAKAARQLTRLHRVMREAAMQSRRVWLPTLDGPVAYADVVAGFGTMVADPAGEPLTAVVDHAVTTDGVTVVIGPEGGFTGDELALAPRLVSFGEHVLRIETAAVVAAARFLT